MIVDVRTYTLIPRKTPHYLEKFEKLALPVVKRHGLELMGFYTSQIGALNQVVHLWRYESLADLETKRNGTRATPTRPGPNFWPAPRAWSSCRRTSSPFASVCLVKGMFTGNCRS